MSKTYGTRLDLNLLEALDALLEAGTVTGAARRLGLTQPSMSRTLQRLRQAFGDPLLVRAGRQLVPTPLARRLQPQLHQALAQLRRVITPVEPFEPATARATFHLASADYGLAVLLPPLLQRLATDAPGVDLVMHPLGPDTLTQLAQGPLDGVLMPREAASVPRAGAARGLVWSRLLREDFVALVRRGHPACARPLTPRALAQLPHLFVAPSAQPFGVVDQRLEALGLERRIALRVPSFLVAPLVVASSDLVAVLARRIAQQAAAHQPVTCLELPLEVPPFTVSLGWHERSRADPAHRWFRRLVGEVARG